MRVSKASLVERWKSDAKWKQRWEHIARWLFGNNEAMDMAEEMEYTSDGYLDLRGFPMDWEPKRDRQRPDLLQDARGVIINKIFERVDFSYANFNSRYMIKCKFRNCIFDNTMMHNITEKQCSFIDCIFRKGVYGGFLGLGESEYKNVQFLSVKMYKTWMCWPDFEDCLFHNCNLKATDFGGSHFKNVKFVGKVEDVWFRGKYECPKQGEYYESKYERWNKIVPMEVDFSEAELSYIGVEDCCDLSRIILPNDGSCYIINNIQNMRTALEDNKKISNISNILLRFHLRDREGKGILCLVDVYKYIEKYVEPEEQKEIYNLCKEACNDLLNKGILTLGNRTLREEVL